MLREDHRCVVWRGRQGQEMVMSGPNPRLSLANTTLYREFQAERDEILRHKWLESEKAGRDVGFEFALTDWNLKYRAEWRRHRQAASQQGNN